MAETRVTAGGKGGLDTVAAIKIWQEILGTETEAQRQFESRWGLYKAPKRLPREVLRQQRELAQSASSPALNVAAKEVLGGTSVRSETRTPARSVAEESGNSKIEFINDRHRLMHRFREVPKKRYNKPLTANMELGWRPNLERGLGTVNMFGIKHSTDLFPEM
mmetsp:Transcript_38474/g.59897  ORF Transcript_38474/g.59897 Transcript_38474/m.59897 type:complete len:163 (+) Transcript_38474:100-588(+)|eukprot:CAMPEP_0169231114 /NCGR_PEP_ID=MMETSP1016-20121227/26318_1 /TAXON_ID=342587 /ORGANISM="Karlodinium micrum, Strain CCMP2283" /LENGTH=162 /DNA_ID=CAMNT_0009310185 /DNA_START=92 /DNA_END=580 /DNA_ORIENTATION=-